MTRHPLPLLRGLALALACPAAGAGAWVLARDPLLAVAHPLHAGGPGALASADLAKVLAAGCAAALLGCAGWLLLGALVAAVAAVGRVLAPGSAVFPALAALAERVSPAVARGVTVAVLGLAVGGSVTGPALADPSAGSTGHPRHPAATGLDGLALPDRVAGPPPHATRPGPPRAAGPAPALVVVHPGDSLWSIAAGRLPRGADDGRVAAAWHRLWRANATRVGTDPDLIHPGTHLVVPPPATPHPAPHGEEPR